MATTTISGAGAHALAALTDRIPTSKGGVKGYLTPAQILDVFSVKRHGAVGDGVTDDEPAIQLALDEAESNGGGRVYLPGPAVYGVGSRIEIPDNVTMCGDGPYVSGLKVLSSFSTTTAVIENKSYTLVDGSLAAPGIVLRDFYIDGSDRDFPDWLSQSNGTAVTDPEADYRVGGCLAPTTFATATGSLTDGVLTSVTPGVSGSGYVYPPTVWVTGDGTGAQVSASISAGAVTGYTIVDGGAGYTTITLEVAGGGADPVTALYGANRRNQNYARTTECVRLIKCQSPVVQNVRFVGYKGINVGDLGCDQAVIDGCEFVGGGQSDFVGAAVWAGAFSNNAQPYYRQGTKTIITRNRVRNWDRIPFTLGGVGQIVSGNSVDGFKEAFAYTATGQDTLIVGNIAERGRISDIVCNFVEANDEGVTIANNIVSDVDGEFLTLWQDNTTVDGNTFRAGSPVDDTYPFGPFSERVGFGTGTAAIAGANRNIKSMVVVYGTDSPNGVSITRNNVIDDAGMFDYFVGFSSGAAGSISNVLVSENNIARFGGIIADIDSANTLVDKDTPLRIVNNLGHSSVGSVVSTTAIASAFSGVVRLDFGFRPRAIIAITRAAATATIAHTTSFFADDVAKNPGTTGASNTSGEMILTGIGDPLDIYLAGLTLGGIQVRDAAGTLIFSASAIGFDHGGWSMNVVTCTTNMSITAIGWP